MCDARARRDAVWPCAGVAAGQRVHPRLGVPWELRVCSLEGVVSEQGAFVEATEEPVPVFDGYESTTQQTVFRSRSHGGRRPIAMLYLGLPAALATGAAGTGVGEVATQRSD